MISTVVIAGAVSDVHAAFSWVVVGANAVAGTWALVAHRFERFRTRALWLFTAVAQSTLFVQAGIGSWMIAQQGREAPPNHALYGFASLAIVGIIYSYRQQLGESRYLLYAGGGLFLMGMGLRAVALDGP